MTTLNNMLFPNNLDDYSVILNKYKLNYRESELYYEVGNPFKNEGWIFYIPIIKDSFFILFETLVPFLIKNNISFSIPKSDNTFNKLMDEASMVNSFGKIICAFPNNQEDLSEIAINLKSLTDSFKGYFVSSAYRLSSLLFTRYQKENDSTMDNIASVINSFQFPNDKFQQQFFEFYDDLSWPFHSITNPKISIANVGDIVHKGYQIVEILANNFHGIVMKASYSPGFFKKKRNCVIKAGFNGMCRDNWGRDINDRYLWQLDLYKELKNLIPIPQVIDFFSEGDITYLVFEYIDGFTFQNYLKQLNGYYSWLDLPSGNKHVVISLIYEIISIVKVLHENGYLHRDLTFHNIMIDQKGKPYLIDLELVYAKYKNFPAPPFPLGTFGFMSPEQALFSDPEYPQDIYYIGTLLLSCIVGLLPQKFDKINKGKFVNNLLYFINDPKIVDLIVSCIEPPAKRPSIQYVQVQLIEIIKQYSKNDYLTDVQEISIEQVRSTIQFAINYIVSRNIVLEFKDERFSEVTVSHEIDHLGNFGLYNGYAGVLYIISIAKSQGITIGSKDSLFKIFNSLNKVMLLSDPPKGGLYFGAQGVAMSLAIAADNGLIDINDSLLNFFDEIFKSPPLDLDIIEGIAGAGIALLHCKNYMNKDLVKELLVFYCEKLIQSQNNDGEWYFPNNNSNSKEVFTGFEIGVAGIVWFLLEAGVFLNAEDIIKRAVMAIQWLVSIASYDGSKYSWTISNNKREKASLFSGSIGIALVLIKAYEVTRNVSFKSIAENILINKPARIVLNEDQFSSGLPGLGQVYLEAFRVFNDVQWYERAKWIVGLYLNSSIVKGEHTYWIQQNFNIPSIGLFSGNGCIIHLLIRFLNPEGVKFSVFQS